MTNCKKKSNASEKSTEKYCSSCPSQPKFVEENKTCHPLTSHVTPSFSHAKESRTPFDLYWLQYYNQHAEKTNYDLVLVKESYACSSDISCPTGYICNNGQCMQGVLASPSPSESYGCSSDNDCSPGNKCIKGQCTFGSFF
tara:strand:+ start:10 stop:432 length:423 start_codon:yes stop_codon:yes gene_type:complete